MEKVDNTLVKVEIERGRTWLLSLLVLLAALVIITLLMTPSIGQLEVKSNPAGNVEEEAMVVEGRTPRPMPVVEEYFAKGWDFRARNTEEQVLVVTTAEESFESKLFKIGSAINLCAHLGYAPPLVLVDALRTTDSEVPIACQDLPELLQDIFPRLRILSVPDPETHLSAIFPQAMRLQGSFRRESVQREDFCVFPKLESSTIVVSGTWESWEYVDDYRPALFELLEFHPVIYHHCRKSYPVIFDRRTPVRGIFIGDAKNLPVEEIRRFIYRNPIDNERVLVFLSRDLDLEKDSRWAELESEFKNRALFVSGEPTHVQIYLGALCRELLVDLSTVGWWVGFHGIHRGKTVYYTDPGVEIPLIEHYLHPAFRSNKN
jgi:hypothetical protein